MGFCPYNALVPLLGREATMITPPVLRATRTLCLSLLLAPALGLTALSSRAEAGTFTSLYSFCADLTICVDGSFPNDLLQGSDGNFYGTTAGGGNFSAGTVFKVTPDGSLSTLYTFTGDIDGSTPNALAKGKGSKFFYGITQVGGNPDASSGTVFKIDTAGNLSTLYTFTGASDGGNPLAAPTLGSGYALYGTTSAGGQFGAGTIYKFLPNSSVSALGSFNFNNGSGSSAELLSTGKNNFVGTSTIGGQFGLGNIYQVNAKGKVTSLYSFTGGSDGELPNAGLILGADGNYYGTTEEGGDLGLGTIFQVSPIGTLTTLYTFSGPDGASPTSALVLGSDGNFYGTTSSGGDFGFGTIFQLTPDGTFTVLYSFNSTDGAAPNTLLLASDGAFYSTTTSGGLYGQGTIFKFQP